MSRPIAEAEAELASTAPEADADDLIVADPGGVAPDAPSWAVASASSLAAPLAGEKTSGEGKTPTPSPAAIPTQTSIPTPAAIPVPAAIPSFDRPPPPDSAITFPVPARSAARRSRLPLLLGVVCGVAGFFLGLALVRGLGLEIVRTPPPRAPEPIAHATGEAAPVEPSPPRPIAPPSAPQSVERGPAPSPAPAAPPPPAPKAPARRSPGRGVLSVTAPPDTDVLVDGRWVGKGSVRTELPEGPHRVEARRGDAQVAERFTLHAGETWTYDVTPTP